MSVLTVVGLKVVVHISDDGWMTRCGARANQPATASEVATLPACKRCAS